MITRTMLKLCAVVAVALAAAAGAVARQEPVKEVVRVTPCEGGEPVAVPATLRAQAFADRLMAGWLARQDPTVAAAWVRERDAALGAAEPAAAQAPQQPIDFTARDYAMWERELKREIAYGDQVFHDDKLVGSPEGVSCAMCHPNGSNTHPETYPKFQVQLKRVALLRDMINWCIENPVRGPKLAPDDPKMRALEAYILAQRKGTVLEFGKH